MTSHVTTYVVGDPCSHRWHAANRARADRRIAYRDVNRQAQWRWGTTESSITKLASFRRTGKATLIGRQDDAIHLRVEPFATKYQPWHNHAHHIIPRSVLAGALEQIANNASPHEGRAFDVMVHGLLDEPYNLNHEPNVMMLPVEDDDAVAMGLPRHLEGSGPGAVDHPVYNIEVKKMTIKRLAPAYEALMVAIKTAKHQREDEVPAVRHVLDGVSSLTYDEILSKTALYRMVGGTKVSLDKIAPILFI
ncbi:MAG: hypothetical protein AAGF11_20405 [Myxococcota bacterium]